MAGRKGASGRPAASVDKTVKDHIKQALAEDPTALLTIWREVITKAKQGSDKHQTILFNYLYGKPKENLEQPTEMIIRVTHEQ